MSEVPVETLEDIFKEYFPAWKDRITGVKHLSKDCISVMIDKKGECLFGRNRDGTIYFKQVPSQI